MSSPLDPYFRQASEDEFAAWFITQRLQWIADGARNYRLSTTHEERIVHYRAKKGENVAYYDTYGWAEHF